MSVGYSTCHWCHVMERESFEDEEIATYMNSNYVSIKVDREERPDVDSIYMTVVQMMTGRGGWPMTVILTPDREPIFGGTYFPPRDGARGNSRGFLSILQEVKKLQQEQPEKLSAVAAEVSRRVRFSSGSARPADVPGPKAIADAAGNLARSFDPQWGGFGSAPKFPRPSTLELLARYHRRSGDAKALEIVSLTLQKMAAGGMYDHVGGGFHRYSVDREWLVPHFEKMLYDNAQLISMYLEGYQLTGNEHFAEVARDIADYVLKEMTDGGGAFYSATDADSPNPEGHDEEGWFFTWTPAELKTVLGEKLAAVVSRHHGVTAQGNFEGRNIFTVHEPLDEALRVDLEKARAKLYAARARRPAPILDDKILTSWNGLMISALARASLVLDEPRYAKAAVRSAQFILEQLVIDGKLKRSYTDGAVGHDAFLDDFAFLTAAMLDLYETTFDHRWLKQAKSFQATLDKQFADAERGGYFFTASSDQALLTRDKPDYDGAEPSGNSIALLNLLRLEQLTADASYRERAEKGFAAFGGRLQGQGEAVPKMLTALDYYLDEPLQLVIVLPPGGDASPFVEKLRKTFLPNRTLSVGEEGSDETLQGKTAKDGKTTAYVCRNRTCERPTSDPELFAKQLQRVEPLFEN